MADEKPWLLYFSSREDPLQIDQEEYKALIKDMEDQKSGATLKDGSFINLRIASIIKNVHYVSPESIKQTRLKRTLGEEFRHLKNEGVLKTKEEYIKWKKKQLKHKSERK